jgi:hypothetical protein
VTTCRKWQARRRPNCQVELDAVPRTGRARMRAPCSKSRGRRPCAHEHASAEASARLLACERCRALVLICSCCDHGQIYCGNCAEEARRQSVRAAGKRYQATKKGRLAHAARQSAYRAKRKHVPR